MSPAPSTPPLRIITGLVADLGQCAAAQFGLVVGKPRKAAKVAAVLPHEGAKLAGRRSVADRPLDSSAGVGLQRRGDRTDERGRRLRSFLPAQLRAPVCDAATMSQRSEGVTGTLNPNIRGTSPC